MNRDVCVRVVLRDKKPCLVASFRNSSQPVVWHIPLTEAGRLALSLRSDESGWIVSLREEGATSVSEAHFLGRGDAETAYEALRKGMMARASLHEWRGVLYWVFGLLLLGLLLTPLSTGVNGTVKGVTAPSAPAGAQSSASSLLDPKKAAREAFEKSLPAVADDVLPQVQD